MFRAILLGFQGSALVPQIHYLNATMQFLGWDSEVYLMSNEAAAHDMGHAFEDLRRFTASNNDKLVVFYAGHVCAAVDAIDPSRGAMYCHSEVPDSTSRASTACINMTPHLQSIWSTMPNDVLLILQTPWNAAPKIFLDAVPICGQVDQSRHPGRNVQIMSIVYEDVRAPRPRQAHPAYLLPPPVHLQEPGWGLSDALHDFGRRNDNVWQLFQELYQRWNAWQVSAGVGNDWVQIWVNPMCGQPGYFGLMDDDTIKQCMRHEMERMRPGFPEYESELSYVTTESSPEDNAEQKHEIGFRRSI